jgi:hypothetical protein
MATVYLADVTGDGVSPETAFRPSIPAGTRYVTIMLDQVKMKCLIASPNDTLVAAGVIQLLTGTTFETLRSASGQTTVPNGKRNAINTWLNTNGYLPIAAGLTWLNAIHFIARQVNPAADLTTAFVE